MTNLLENNQKLKKTAHGSFKENHLKIKKKISLCNTL